jgi:Sulfotransferase family
MTTVQLFDHQDVVEFLQAKIKPTDEVPWLFIYVPETINDTIRQRFADILQPDCFITPADVQVEKGVDYDTRMSRALDQFAHSEQFQRCRFAAGHVKTFQVDEISELTKARLFTVLRDPVDRLISDFAAQNAGKRLTADKFLEFAKNPANQNTHLQFLCPKGMWKPDDCIEFVRDRFDFIGIAEDLPMTIKMFYAIHGARVHADLAESEKVRQQFSRHNLSADLIHTVAQLNAVDYEIFRYFHDRFIALKDSFYAMADYDEIFRKLAFR